MAEEKRAVYLSVPMIARMSLLLPERPDDPKWEGHRGLWFYDPNLYPELKVGDKVVFESAGETVAVGEVTELLNEAPGPHQFRDYCSRVNGRVFRWKDLSDEEAGLHCGSDDRRAGIQPA